MPSALQITIELSASVELAMLETHIPFAKSVRKLNFKLIMFDIVCLFDLSLITSFF